jgi:hypothetical protein
VDQGTLIGIAIVVAVLCGRSLLNGLRSGYTFVKSRLPKLSSPTGLFTAKVEIEYWKVAALLVAFLLISGGGFRLPSLPDWKLPGWPSLVTKVTSAVYVYEKDSGGVPPFVGAAIGKLNDRGIIAATHEDDATNKTGGVPKQYEFAVPAARTGGLPSIVTMAADRSVIKTIKDPRTEEAVLEAVK